MSTYKLADHSTGQLANKYIHYIDNKLHARRVHTNNAYGILEG